MWPTETKGERLAVQNPQRKSRHSRLSGIYPCHAYRRPSERLSGALRGMSQHLPKPSTQSDREQAAAPDSHRGGVLGGTPSPQLQAVTDTLAWAIARINELEHRIYVLESRTNERNP